LHIPKKKNAYIDTFKAVDRPDVGPTQAHFMVLITISSTTNNVESKLIIPHYLYSTFILLAYINTRNIRGAKYKKFEF